jgi:hypothetical protein
MELSTARAAPIRQARRLAVEALQAAATARRPPPWSISTTGVTSSF